MLLKCYIAFIQHFYKQEMNIRKVRCWTQCGQMFYLFLFCERKQIPKKPHFLYSRIVTWLAGLHHVHIPVKNSLVKNVMLIYQTFIFHVKCYISEKCLLITLTLLYNHKTSRVIHNELYDLRSAVIT